MFWDSSALVPILLPEPRSTEMVSLAGLGEIPVVWWASPVECRSAIHRRHREAPMPRSILDTALDRLQSFFQHADTVPASEEVRSRAGRLLAVHPLRAADALQLAAALVACEEEPMGEKLVSLDQRLREAAIREGFAVIPD